MNNGLSYGVFPTLVVPALARILTCLPYMVSHINSLPSKPNVYYCTNKCKMDSFIVIRLIILFIN